MDQLNDEKRSGFDSLYETTGVYLQKRFLLKSGLKEDIANKIRWAFNPSF